MKYSCLIIFTVFTISWAFPQQNYQQTTNPQTAKIVQHESNIGLDKYNFFYETSDGSQRSEKAELKNVGSKNQAFAVQGSYSYIGTDGKTYKITYIADENGYRATGEHIPKSP